MTLKRIVAVLGVAGTMAACGSELTYNSEIKGLIDSRCATCHQAGGIAPFALTRYDEVAVWAPSIKAATQSRTMPPWPASGDCRDYAYDRSLSDEEIEKIATWVDEGAIEGTPSVGSSAGALEPIEPAGLPRVDLSLDWREPFTPDVAAGDVDAFRCFLIEWPESSPKYITGYHVRPGNRALVHHLVALLIPPEEVADLEARDAADAGPGFACESGMGMGGGGRFEGGSGDLFDRLQGSGLLAGWAPGGDATLLAPGTGMLVRPGSRILLNMHYNVLATAPGPDLTTLDLMVEESVEKPALALFWANPLWPGGTMGIAAGDADVKHSFSFDPTEVLSKDQPLVIHGASLHMHTLGASARLSIDRARRDECLLDIPRWDFNWQLGYQFQAATVLEPGDELSIECHFDNSAGNQPYIDGVRREPVEVNWGEGTLSEMCLGAVLVTRP